jgi:hypothetical protein
MCFESQQTLHFCKKILELIKFIYLLSKTIKFKIQKRKNINYEKEFCLMCSQTVGNKHFVRSANIGLHGTHFRIQSIRVGLEKNQNRL